MVAESVLVRHPLLILSRGRKRAPNWRANGSDHRRLVHPVHAAIRILRCAIGLRPSTLFHLHKVWKKRKYRMLTQGGVPTGATVKLA